MDNYYFRSIGSPAGSGQSPIRRMKKQTLKRITVDLGEFITSLSGEFAALFAQQPQMFELAVKEAEAVAWQTPYPCLVLPTLIEEKLVTAAEWTRRQSALRGGRGNDQTSFAA